MAEGAGQPAAARGVVPVGGEVSIYTSHHFILEIHASFCLNASTLKQLMI